MQKVSGLLVAGVLVLLLCGIVGAGEMDPVGSENLSVIVAPPPDGQDFFYLGETVHFSGVNHISDQTHVRIINYVLRDDDPVFVINVNNGVWSGSYTHTDSTRTGHSQISVKPYSDEVAGTLPVYPEQASVRFRTVPQPKPTPTPNPTPTINDDLFTLKINGVNYQNLNNPSFTWGDIIQFSGTNNAAETNSVYLTLGKPDDNVDWIPPAKCEELNWYVTRSAHIQRKTTAGYGSWSYKWDSGNKVCKYPNVDTVISLELLDVGDIKVPITMKAKIIPTPTPTPDYQAKIAALETRIAAQETQIKTQATQIQEIAVRTPVPTTIPTTSPTTVITTSTPVPTQTPDYEATLIAIQKQIDQQNDIIYQILHFLGLR